METKQTEKPEIKFGSFVYSRSLNQVGYVTHRYDDRAKVDFVNENVDYHVSDLTISKTEEANKLFIVARTLKDYKDHSIWEAARMVLVRLETDMKLAQTTDGGK